MKQRGMCRKGHIIDLPCTWNIQNTCSIDGRSCGILRIWDVPTTLMNDRDTIIAKRRKRA